MTSGSSPHSLRAPSATTSQVDRAAGEMHDGQRHENVRQSRVRAEPRRQAPTAVAPGSITALACDADDVPPLLVLLMVALITRYS
jgi:hypothetical protein